MNLFATILTYVAPSANYRGESEENRTIIQKVTQGRFEYAIVSPEAMRNALREILRGYGLPCNRERLHDADQPAVHFADYPDPAKYADDFFFGHFVAIRTGIPNDIREARKLQLKRDSVVRMNLAKALEPYRHDAVFTQSPQSDKSSPWKNATTSALLHRETTVTAFQYPLALNLHDCRIDEAEPALRSQYRNWLCQLLRAVAELNDVAGNHARSYFEMAPASIVIRLTDSLVAGYDTYGFRPDGTLPEVVAGILAGDYPGREFVLGGQLVREVLSTEQQEALKAQGTRLFRMANRALDAVAHDVCGAGFLETAGAGR